MLFFFSSQQTKLKSVKQECKIINKMQVYSIRNLDKKLHEFQKLRNSSEILIGN